MTKISLITAPASYTEIVEMAEHIKTELTSSQLFASTKLELCYHTLTFFDFAPDELTLSDGETIKNGCQVVCKLFDWDRDLFSKELGEPERQIDFVMQYLKLFLQYDNAPGEILHKLKADTLSHLDAVNNIITNYENIALIANNETPRNQGEKTLKTFYDRCILEREKIEEYLVNDIKNRALVKANGANRFGSSIAFFDVYFDHPYKTSYQDPVRLLDHLQIDKVAHRIGAFTISESKTLKTLYHTDKQKFYEELFKMINQDDTLDLLIRFSEFVPLVSKQRLEIFKELKLLYQNRSWFGFYALGLTQIEGLFGDMCVLCNPRFSNPKANLPDKVNMVRDFYKQSETRLDYFEFEVPNQRNSFLHKGVTTRKGIGVQQEIKTLCNDVLLDLIECLRIYSALDVDANWLNRLVRNPKITEFHSVESFCFYFELVRKVKIHKQYYYFEQQITNLNSIVFPDYIFNIAFEINTVFNDAYINFSNYFNLILVSNSIPFKLEDVRAEELKTIDFSILFFPYDERKSLEILMKIKYFLHNYKQILDTSKFSNDTIKLLEDFHTSEKMKLLSRLSQINHLFKFEK